MTQIATPQIAMPQLEPPLSEIGIPADLALSITPTALPPAIGTTGNPTPKTGFLNCFLSTFVTIFLAELGDKTQLATLLMSAQSHNPWTVFAGAATALIATSLVGVLLGRWLSKVLQPRALERVTGMILAVVSVLLFIDVAGMML
jgi:Ca2+/H+ antiporter, TMEM165/GDT1 family